MPNDGWMDRLTAHLDRGWELVARGDLSGAMASAEQTLEIDAESPDAHNLIGFIHAANGRADVALEHYLHAIDLDNTCLEAMLNAAELMIHPLVDLDGALHLLDDALEFCESAEEIADATVLKIDALLQRDEKTAATILLDTLPNTPTDNAQLNFLLGRAYFELGNLEISKPFLQKATDQASQHSDAHYYLGLLKDAEGDLIGAALSYLSVRHLDRQSAPPAWSPSPERFETVVEAALQRLDETHSKLLLGALIVVCERPGAEVVAEGVDPRTPLLLDDMKSSTGEPRPGRLFVYQRNMERFIADPINIEDAIVEILTRELGAHLEHSGKSRRKKTSQVSLERAAKPFPTCPKVGGDR